MLILLDGHLLSIEKPPARTVGGLVNVYSSIAFIAAKTVRGFSIAYRNKLSSLAFGASNGLPTSQITQEFHHIKMFAHDFHLHGSSGYNSFVSFIIAFKSE